MQIRNYDGEKRRLWLLSYECQVRIKCVFRASSNTIAPKSVTLAFVWSCAHAMCAYWRMSMVEVHRYAYALGSLCALCIVVGMNRIMLQNVQISVWYLCNIYRDLQTDLYWHNNSIIREKWQTVWQICDAGNAPLDNLNTLCPEFTKATQNNMCVCLYIHTNILTIIYLAKSYKGISFVRPNRIGINSVLIIHK